MSRSERAVPCALSPSPLPPTFRLRRAGFLDLPAAARTCSLAFDDDVLFGRLIHPYRRSYPADVDKYWYRRFVVDFWDWSHVFLVTTGPDAADKTKEVVTGFAHWSRIAPGRRENFEAGWGLTGLDPRRLLQPLCRFLMRFLAFISPNRAASKEDELIIERSYNYLDHIWTGERSESWYLECLAVHPDYQRQGQGRALVGWGLQQALREGIACSVIAADGKERFYQACGFNVGPVGRSGEGEGNPLREVPGGLVFFQEKRGVVLPDRDLGSWTYGHGVFDWDDWKKQVEAKRHKMRLLDDLSTASSVQ
ncbi:hypothetical protein G647_04670 [Cladophialophora carrionii CBS 160.54]|uniref:N-acetyltransferase domain-containing protein n=1 Tax=Cladophialophora carrionii CBS 160.54 TaxID=1279043 RepID=V9DEL1_9EURO|nr:uncharacterized protein G647_04670 [Cladophialophora carrionii CBS 160.54]ETI25295.1 hypothetical protein G647_04670 [Cladophialophora carrionii CBS 160.54]